MLKSLRGNFAVGVPLQNCSRPGGHNAEKAETGMSLKKNPRTSIGSIDTPLGFANPDPRSLAELWKHRSVRNLDSLDNPETNCNSKHSEKNNTTDLPRKPPTGVCAQKFGGRTFGLGQWISPRRRRSRHRSRKARPRRPSAALPPNRCSSCASCLPSAFQAACACG